MPRCLVSHPVLSPLAPTDEKKTNNLSICTADSTPKWIVGSGMGDCLSLTNGSGNAVLGQVALYSLWLFAQCTDVLKDHVEAKKKTVPNPMNIH
mmetsp:Transcript_33385/g.59823  ORF Transcript_33385/g.59823 Transcript_33385/m.59823 type:complete len:94 (-) Transcript_33385:1465-1746(-)